MSVEIKLQSAHQVDIDELLYFLTASTGGELANARGNRFLQTPGMAIWPYVLDAENPSEAQELTDAGLGFRSRVVVQFKVRGPASLEEKDAGWVMMLNTVLDFVRAYPGDTALVFDCERIIMRGNGNDVVFDEWDGLDEDPMLTPIISRYPRQRFDQPFL